MARLQHFEEASKGSIEPGKIADFVILSDDPLSVDPETLADLEVMVTIKEDTVIFEAKTGVQKTNLRLSPFATDPIVAERFLHAMYEGLNGVH